LEKTIDTIFKFYGRRPIYILSMFFFLMFIIPSAAAQNIQTMLVGRFLDGLAGSAFLSVAAGTVADLFIPSQIQAPMMFYTLTPFIGPVMGPAIGGFINQFTTWRWTFYVLLIWTGITLITILFVPETFHPVLLARKAALLRKETGDSSYRSASEIAIAKKSVSGAVMQSCYRPFQLLFLDPMNCLLDLYTALLLGILYLFFGAFPLVFRTNHGFELWQTGLTFMGLVIGQVIAVLTNPLWHKNYLRLVANSKKYAEKGEEDKKPDPEFRLPPAILGGVLVPISLFWFGWTTYSSVHWVVPIIGSILFGSG
jgi:multidrug resistance protein